MTLHPAGLAVTAAFGLVLLARGGPADRIAAVVATARLDWMTLTNSCRPTPR